MENIYNKKYTKDGYYWGKTPSKMCYKVLKLSPPDRPLKLLDIGCGEGRNAVLFARNGYKVTAFDLSIKGIEKTKKMAEEAGVSMKLFKADVNAFRLEENFDILFSSGVLHYIPKELKEEIFKNYKTYTIKNGLHVFSVFVNKPFIKKAPDAEDKTQRWISGELFTFYHDWKIEYCEEEIFDCGSGGIPHKHAINRVIARKIM